ncbi:hypothetical protein HH1059_20630 [Halorhodospira halochloris]|uniref:Uncharacterized protein n=1 Tax=Halorhodospira halochloris TaxID=1052 RepID=A0A2Z6EZS9_HALHR|nr:hypothetical protein HH1059_20630 [Halorhodospira halochloris]
MALAAHERTAILTASGHKGNPYAGRPKVREHIAGEFHVADNHKALQKVQWYGARLFIRFSD